jgi:hypothetical protein
MKKMIFFCAFLGIACAAQAYAGAAPTVVRATALNDELIKQFSSGNGDLVVEFKGGDRLPVSINSSGDLLETSDAGSASSASWNVKRDFYLKLQGKALLLSLDGQNFKPLQDMLSGSLTIGATAPADGSASQISINLQALLKQ